MKAPKRKARPPVPVYDLAYQRDFLSALLQDQTQSVQCATLRSALDAAFFDDANVQAAVAVLQAYDTLYPAQVYQRRALRDLAEQFVRDARSKDKASAEEARDTLLDLFDANISDAAYLLDTGVRFLRFRQQARLAEEIADGLRTFDPEKIHAAFVRGLSITVNVATVHDYVGDTEDAIKRRASKSKNAIPIPVEGYQPYFNHGGPERGSINVILAPTNVGKTSCSVAFGAWLVEAGYKVAHVTLETDIDELRGRYDVAFSGVPLRTVEQHPDKVRSVAARIAQTHGNALMMERFLPYELTPTKLETWLLFLRASHSFVPDVVLIDSPDDMQPNDSVYAKDSSGEYHSQGALYRELDALAKRQNLVLWVTTQAGRVAIENATVNVKDISDSLKKAQRARVIVAIAQTHAESTQSPQEARLILCKNTYGPKNIILSVQLDWALQRIVEM